jgi:hypothetical protein
MRLQTQDEDSIIVLVKRLSSNPNVVASLEINPRRVTKTECGDDTKAYRRPNQKHPAKPKYKDKR